MSRMKKISMFATIFILSTSILLTNSSAQFGARTEIKIPDISGYITLKCDFHQHTVFSDGNVWPTIRPQEAWLEGLDAFAVTDHIEYLPYEKDVVANHNRSHEIAQSKAKSFDLILIKGAEITREMPPGHFNAIFLKDVNPLDTETYLDAMKAAIDQGAFLFWNHPGWRQPNDKAIWYPEHTEIFAKGWMHGIEVVNGNTYYPEAYQWALDKKLTMLGNSDVHDPINLDYDFANGEHRPMTLVFVTEKTEQAVKEALFARRTAVYSGNRLIGEEQFLKPIFEASIEIKNPLVAVKGNDKQNIQIYNKSDLNFELIATGENDLITFPDKLTLYTNRTVLLSVRGKSDVPLGKKEIKLPFKVTNLLIAPEQGLLIEIKFNVNFIEM